MDYLRLNDDNMLEVIPEASRDQQMSFIDTYRQTQADNTAQIGQAAHALGSDLTAPYGGLHGPSAYIKSRYQTPQIESRIAGLRTAAQLSALNQLIANDQNRWQNKVNQAYRNAIKAATDAAKKGDVQTNVINPVTVEGRLGAANTDVGTDAPYGVTRVYAGGSFGGKPLYHETANDVNGNATSNEIGSGASNIHFGKSPNSSFNILTPINQAFNAMTFGAPGVLLNLWDAFN